MTGGKRPSMTRQVAVGTGLSVLVAVLAAGALALGLVRHAYDARARAVLHQDAVLVAALSSADKTANAAIAPGRPVARLLLAGGVRVVRVHANGQLRGRFVLGEDDLARASRGETFSGTRRLGGVRFFLESQPIPGDGAVVLLQRTADARAVTASVLRKLGLALLVGLLAAVMTGLFVARRLTRPLVRARDAARRLAAGDRAVRLDDSGPAELADLAESLNELALALAVSEGRQREFLLSVSHELRTPLTAILGFAEALGDEVTTGADVPAAGRVIEEEGRRLQRLVSDLLDLARSDADDFPVEVSPVDLTGLMTRAGEVWEQRCAAVGVVFRAELPDRPVVIRTDAGRVRQVLDNLAENALRVTPSGKPVVFSLSQQPSGTAVLEVRDGGPGLTESDQAVAFDRSVLYERYRGVRKVGTGLGLALVGALVGRLGGAISAGSAPEGGAAFTLTLPGELVLARTTPVVAHRPG